jgi:hypothetical protein
MTSVANAVEMDLEDSATYERMAEAIAFMRQPPPQPA